ncbi:MAG: AMP-binding protein, partial [Lachnospiraceae bacterium]|nr:AMP-binding protein [Lachnospiraceae bacterium]
QAPFDFDVSVKDVYSGLYTGARVALIPREYFSNPAMLMDFLCENKVTTLIWAVSAMCFVSIMNGLEYKTPDRINKIMFSGEMMPVKQLNKWRKFIPHASYVNLYGPTEITCNCSYHILDRDYEKNEIIPIGIPFRNEKVFLLDEKDRLIREPELEGEICVSGSCLALGYYKDKEKTDRVFVQNPLNKDFYERIYRTGDMGKYDEEGRLIYTSRKDFQIKHMGQRIELGEIEVAAMSIEGSDRAACLYDSKRKRICLIYSGSIEKEDLSEKLHLKLPPYMMPGKTVKLSELPLNKNGKIDRKALEEYL